MGKKKMEEIREENMESDTQGCPLYPIHPGGVIIREVVEPQPSTKPSPQTEPNKK